MQIKIDIFHSVQCRIKWKRMMWCQITHHLILVMFKDGTWMTKGCMAICSVLPLLLWGIESSEARAQSLWSAAIALEKTLTGFDLVKQGNTDWAGCCQRKEYPPIPNNEVEKKHLYRERPKKYQLPCQGKIINTQQVASQLFPCPAVTKPQIGIGHFRK